MKTLYNVWLQKKIKNQFYRHPFIFFSLCLIVGILWGDGAQKISPALPGAVAVVLFTGGILLSNLGRKRYRLIWALLAAFFFLGWMRICQEKTLPPDHIANLFLRKPVIVEGIVDQPVRHYYKRTELFLRSEKVIRPSSGKGFREKVQKVSGVIRLGARFQLPSLKYGDRIQVRTYLYKPRNYRNPGGFDYRAYLQRKGIYLLGRIRTAGDITLLSSSPSLMGRLFDFRNRFSRFIGSDTSEKQFLVTVMLGMREVLPYSLKNSFRRTGTAHLLAISGLHVGILATFFFAFFREIWRLLPFKVYLQLTRKIRPGKVAAFLSIPPLIAYTFLAGSSTPTIRALIMITAYLTATVLERDKEYFNILGIAAAVILLWRPSSLYNVGFQLSFVIVFFIIYIMTTYTAATQADPWKPLANKTSVIEKYILRGCSFFLISLSAYLAALPLVSYHFKQISLVGFGASLIAVLLFSFTLPFGIISLILFPVSQGLSEFFIIICLKSMYFLVEWVKWLGSYDWASILVYQPSLLLIVVIYAFYLCLGRIHRHRSARYGAGAFFLTGLLLLLPPRGDNRLQVSFLDVGHGDATFIRTPRGKTLLIDAGKSSGFSLDIGKKVVAPFLLHEWVGKLDHVILSHHHADHFGGLPYIVNNFRIGEFWDTPGYSRSYKKVKNVIEKKEIPVRYITAGEHFDLDKEVRMEVLHPTNSFLKTSSHKINDRSIVLRLVYKNVSFLFTGDIENKAETSLVSSGADITASVLKIPHHGAGTSSSQAFLQAVQPEFAVLFRSSYPKSNYTDKDILNQYQNLGIRLLKTQQEGCITFYTDGDTLWLETARGTRAIRTMVPSQNIQVKWRGK